MSDTSAFLATLTAQLHTLPTSNPDQAFIRRYLGTPRPVLGVRADDLRRLARETAKAHQNWPDVAKAYRKDTQKAPPPATSKQPLRLTFRTNQQYAVGTPRVATSAIAV